jgi:hypothetical protein
MVRALRCAAPPLIAGALVLGAIAGRYFAATDPLRQLAPPLRGSLKAESGALREDAVLRPAAAGFYLGWNLGIYVHPLYPTASNRTPASSRAAREHVQRLLRVQLLGRRQVQSAGDVSRRGVTWVA